MRKTICIIAAILCCVFLTFMVNVENTDKAYIEQTQEQAVEKAESKPVKSNGYEVELPWESNKVQYPEGIAITVCGQDILYGEPVEGIAFEDDILIFDNVSVGNGEESTGVELTGFNSIEIKLIGENVFDTAAAVNGCENITFIGDGSIHSTGKISESNVLVQMVSLDLRDSVKVSEAVKSLYQRIDVYDDAFMTTTDVNSPTICLNGNGTFTAEHCTARNMIQLNDNSVFTVTGNPDDSEPYDSCAIRDVRYLYINDNSRFVASNYCEATIGFTDKDAELVISDNGILEIKGNASSEAISQPLYSDRKVIMNDNAVVKITDALVGFYGYNFIINGGSFSCEAVENGVPFLFEKKGFKINGEVISQSHNEYSLIPYEDTNCYCIYADGEFVESFSISVKQKEAE